VKTSCKSEKLNWDGSLKDGEKQVEIIEKSIELMR
jgi:hypothetical protein